MPSVKEKQSQTPDKSSKDRFFAIREERLQYRTGLNYEYNKDKWGFIAKEQSERVSRWKNY